METGFNTMMLLDKWRKNEGRVRQAGEIARERACTAGVPSYYRDPALGDGIVKEMPDGRRILIDEADEEEPRWADLHDESSVLAQEAWLVARNGDPGRARELYLEAAAREAEAYAALPVHVTRSRGILAVSLVALLTKGGDEQGARSRATALLRDSELPAWAAAQLRDACSGEREIATEGSDVRENRPSGQPVVREEGSGG